MTSGLPKDYFQTLSKAEQSHRPKIDQALVGSWALFCPLFWMRLTSLYGQMSGPKYIQLAKFMSLKKVIPTDSGLFDDVLGFEFQANSGVKRGGEGFPF